jgi:glucose/arabinose dehydrogenase
MLILALILGACDSDTAQPTATTGVQQPQPTLPAQQNPTSTAAAPVEVSTATTVPVSEQPTSTQPAPEASTPTQPAHEQPTAAATQPPATSGNGTLALGPVTVETTDTTRQGVFQTERTINLPQGFHINVYALIGGVRWLARTPTGTLYATSPAQGKVFILPDTNNDGVADEVKVFADKLPGVHGIAFYADSIYVATEDSIYKLTDSNQDGVADLRTVIATDLPSGGGHSTRTIAFGFDGNLYVSAGSSCNVCQETNEKRAASSQYTADGRFQRVYTSGLRNAVGMIFHPGTGQMWVTNNGRDNLGDNIPPETIYAPQEGMNYGWPFCYGDRVPDETQNPPAGFCEKTGVPAVKMQAHSAPLGLAFYNGGKFPADSDGDLYVAFHGSWNRSVPTGYKLVRINVKDNQPDASAGDQLVQDFATGWQTTEGVWGRPVDPLVAPDGSLLLTDDQAGAIYRIYYAGDQNP